MKGTGNVVLCFFGDGAANTGNFHESLNMAALWDLPVVYIIENNLYGMSVPIKNAAAKLSLADRGCAYGIEHAVVDGMDLLAVREAVRRAVDHARSGKGPYLLEAQTYRWYGHSRSDPRAYRTKDEEAEWKARDPIPNFSKLLVEQGVATQDEIDAIEQKVEKAIEQATDFALGSPMPPAEELENFVYVPFKWTQADVEREKELRELVRRGSRDSHGGLSSGSSGGHARGDAARRARVLDGRGHRIVRRRLWCDQGPVPGVWRGAGSRYSDLRSRHCWCGYWRCYGRDATDGRDHVRGLHAVGHGSAR